MFWHFLTPLVAALLAGAAAGVVVEAASGEPSGWFWHSQSWLWSLVWCRTSHVLGPLLMSGFFQSLALDQSEALMSLSFHPWRAFNRHSLIQSYDNPSRIVVCRVEDEKLIKLSLFLTLSDSICDGCWHWNAEICVCVCLQQTPWILWQVLQIANDWKDAKSHKLPAIEQAGAAFGISYYMISSYHFEEKWFSVKISYFLQGA